MEYIEGKEGSAHLFTLSGKFTFADHDIFRNIVNIIKKDSISTLIMDFEKVEFVDSAALGMLLIAREESQKKNVEVVLQNAQGQIEKMFKVSQFDSLFTVR